MRIIAFDLFFTAGAFKCVIADYNIITIIIIIPYFSDIGHAVWNDDTCQTSTVPKRRFPDFCYAVGNDDFSDVFIGALFQCFLSSLKISPCSSALRIASKLEKSLSDISFLHILLVCYSLLYNIITSDK